ncbi:hypothetical protein ACFFGT_11010 [Mucilaginibacter angelicae]|uniref:Uncharacterized protein n=1 Tax=Mucilaginibacter angelicae TaxID=869718 RepID=A0ABV6L5H6_9SPHI
MTGYFKGRSETSVSSKSTNKNVLSVYVKILENAYSDSDYWYLTGNDFLLDKLYDLDDLDLLELRHDLCNWAPNELEIFSGALESDYSGSHDDLLPKRIYLYGYLMTLANQYLDIDKRIAARLININTDFISEGYLKDKRLLEEIKKTLNSVEIVPGIIGDPTKCYMDIVRFALIKNTIQKLFDAAN